MNRTDGRAVVDVSHLPTNAAGPRSPLWWGAMSVVAIEGTMMGLVLVSYFYLRGYHDVWPPAPIGRPAFLLAAAQAALLFASLAPILLSWRAGRQERLRPARAWLLVATLLGAALLVLRAYEIRFIPFRWDHHAYGSLFWLALGLHTFHVLTSVIENAVLLTLFYKGPLEKEHFSDLEAAVILWVFAVTEWLPGFAIVYLSPAAFPR